MQFFQQGSVWIRRVEHIVLRVLALLFSMGSAHAIRWFFSPLDGVDFLMPIITWVIAGGFGALGYFVSRGLAHRIMNRERIWAYAPIVVVVEFVEIFCNYALAAAVIQRATWLEAVPPAQQEILTYLTYVVLSVIPLVSLLLAVVDVDLARNKNAPVAGGLGGWKAGARPQPKVPSAGPYSQGYQAQQQKGGHNGTPPLGVVP